MRAIALVALAGLTLGLVPLSTPADDKPAARTVATADTGKEPVTVAAYAVDNVLHVFYRNNDGDILELYRGRKAEGTKDWASKNLMVETKAPKAASNPSAYFAKGNLGLIENATQHVLYRGTDDQIHELLLAPKAEKWEHRNVSADAKAPKAAGDPFGFLSETPLVQHVFFRTADGAIADLFRAQDEKTWRFNDLTAEAKAPRAAGDPCAYQEGGTVPGRAGTQHVLYRGDDSQIQELFLGSGQSKWGHNNLSREAKAPKAVGDPAAYVWQTDNVLHVFFRGEDGGVYDLYRIRDGDNKAWRANNLTTEAKSSKAAGDPFCYLDGTTQHVLYRGDNDQIHELFLAAKQDKWKSNNISAEAKAPKASGDPSGFAIADVQHVFFPTTDGVYELSNDPKGTERGWHGHSIMPGKKP
jgi:hypothetical protein